MANDTPPPATLNTILDIDPFCILAAGLQDRLDADPEEDESLRRSLAEYGQQVPVLVRPHPTRPDHYQIVYGRRRVLALRDLNLPVKALVRHLDDQSLVMAQGQENTQHRGLSFIEKANFARQMAEAGYPRKIICDAITTDKTQISRMLSLTTRLSPDLIAQIGAAPGVGRDRWLALADLLKDTRTTEDELSSLITLAGQGQRSNQRFQVAYNYMAGLMAKERAAATPTQTMRRTLFDTEGAAIGQARFDTNFCTVRLRLAKSENFGPWLVDHLPFLLDRYRIDALTRTHLAPES